MTELRSNGSNTEVLQALNVSGVDYLVIGGVACVFHGCRDRFEVDDLDVLLRPSTENMERFITALERVGLKRPAEPSELARPAVQIPLKTIHYMDAVTPPPGMPFDLLSSGAQSTTVNGVPVRVVSRDSLVLLKHAAVAAGGDAAGKHGADLRRLSGA